MATFTGQLISATYDAILKTSDNDHIGSTAKQITDGLGNSTPLYISTTQIGIGITPTEAFHVLGNALITGNITVNTDATISGNLSWGSLTDSGESITITKFVDAADGIANNNNDTTIPTSAAVKSFVDSSITAQDLDFLTDSGTGQVDLDSQSLNVLGTTNQIDTTGLNQTITLSLPSTVHRNLQGNVIGNVTGNLTGNVTGNVTGNLTGNVTGGTISGTTGTFSGNVLITNNSTPTLQLLDTNNNANLQIYAGVSEVVVGSFSTHPLKFVQNTGTALTIDTSKDATFVGSVTATGFSGGLTGNVTGNVTGNLTGNVTGGTISGVLADGVTATTQTDGDNSTKVATTAYVDTAITGHDTLAEVLAEGNTTGGTDIAVSSGDDITFTSTSKAIFNTALEISEDGSSGGVIKHDGTGGLVLKSDAVNINGLAGGVGLQYVEGGAISLRHNNSLKLETTSYGINVTGAINADNYINIEGGTNPYLRIQDTTNEKYLNLYSSDNESAIVYTQDTFKISSGVDFLNQTPRLTIDSSGNATFAGNLTAVRGIFNSGTTNNVASFTSTDATAKLQCVDNAGLVNFGANGDDFIVQPAGGTTQFTVGSSSSTFAGNITFGDSHFIGDDASDNLLIQSSANENIIIDSLDDLFFRNSGSTHLTVKSTGRVGIGTTSPDYNLEIESASSPAIATKDTTNNVITKMFSANSQGFVGTESNHDLRIRTNNTDKLTITSGGLVGIGTSTPSRPLHISADTPAIRLQDTTANDYAELVSVNGDLYIRSDEGNTQADSTIRFQIDQSERMRIDGTGNVGIGTTTMNTTLNLYSASNTQIGFQDASTGTTSADGFRIGYNGTYGQMWLFENAAMRFATNNTERMRIDSSGNVIQAATHIIKNAFSDSSGLKLSQESSDESRIFNHFSGALTFGTANTERMRIDSSGNVLINSGVYLSWGTNGASSIEGSTVSNKLQFRTNSANAMIIDSSGSVGIGTTNPQDALDIDWDTEGVATDNSGIRVRAYRPHLNLIDRSGYSSTNGHNFQIKADSAKLQFNATSADNETFDLTRMVIDKDGDVGIGTDSPASKFEVYGGSSGVNDVDRYIRFKASNGEKRFDFYVGGTGNASSLGMYTSDGTTKNVQISAGGTSYFNAGNVGIGTTTPTYGKITVTESGSAYTGDYIYGGTSGSYGALRCTLSASNNPSFIDFFRSSYSTTVPVGAIVTSGSNCLYQSYSDYRMKENVSELTGALDKVNNIQPKIFNYKEDTETTYQGFIAHELQEVVPQAVSGNKDEVNEDGTPKYQGVDNSHIVPLLVGAIQELKAEIELLKTQINN